MSKPTVRQKKLLQEIKKQIDYLIQSNDIHSPSHGSDIACLSESVHDENGIEYFKDGELDNVEDLVGQLWSSISHLDKCQMREGQRLWFAFNHSVRDRPAHQRIGQWIDSCFNSVMTDELKSKPHVVELMNRLPDIWECTEAEDQKVQKYYEIVHRIFTVQ